jgi:DNA-binding NarL/FixJ family response regulator
MGTPTMLAPASASGRRLGARERCVLLRPEFASGSADGARDHRDMAGDELVASCLAEGREALMAGDPVTARAAFTRLQQDGPRADALEGLARADYLEGHFARAVEQWEHAYAVHRANGDFAGAVRCARMLGYMNGAVLGDRAVMSGWLARAQTLLGDAPDSLEAGWVALSVGMFSGDRAVREERFREAVELGRRHDAVDLALVAQAYLGANLVHGDRVDEGMVLLDEVLAAIAGYETDDFFVLGDVFCQLFAACEHAHDVTRADQWMRVGELVATRRNSPTVAMFCRTHYGGILTAAGRWTEADAALTEALRLWNLGYRSIGPDALVRLAELRIRQGRLEEAEALLEGCDLTEDTAGPLANMYLARGEVGLARDVLERALDGADRSSTTAAPLLALLVEALVAAGACQEANAAAEELQQCATVHPLPYLQATAALAQGRVCIATGAGDARSCLRAALAGFARAHLPMEAARARLELAAAVLDDQPDVARSEARAAMVAFERLPAPRHVDAAAALLRGLGVRPASGKRSDGLLTRREAEVLELLGHGLSNPEIADRLYISRKTVEHHVGNLLAKLGLRSRAEAAAYAARHQPGAK